MMINVRNGTALKWSFLVFLLHITTFYMTVALFILMLHMYYTVTLQMRSSEWLIVEPRSLWNMPFLRTIILVNISKHFSQPMRCCQNLMVDRKSLNQCFKDKNLRHAEYSFWLNIFYLLSSTFNIFSISFSFYKLSKCCLPLLRRPQDELCIHVVNHLELSG